MNALRYAFAEALASLWRERTSAVFSIATIGGTLLIFSAFLLVMTNLERLLASWSTGAEVSVYLTDTVSEAERSAIERLIVQSEIVQAREYVPKSEALARFERDFHDLAGVASTFEHNPFPASFEVRVRPVAADSEAIAALAARLAEVPGVADVRYDRRWLERLSTVVMVMRGVILALAGILVVGAALTVSNVVRLAFQARRDEIEIMQLVGAPLGCIRGPFLAEGLIQGAAGAVTALTALGVAFWVARARYGDLAAAAVGLDGFSFLPLQLCLLILGGGMAVGCLGGLLATWGLGTKRPPVTQPELDAA